MPSMQKFAQDKFGSLPGSFIFQIPRRLETRSVLLIEEGKLTEEEIFFGVFYKFWAPVAFFHLVRG